MVPRGRDAGRLGRRDPERRARVRDALDAGERPLVVAAGRVEPQKGHRFLVEAVPALLDRHPSLLVVVAGRRGNASSELDERIAALGLGDHVRLLGFREDVPDLLVAADVFAFPSTHEGLGGTLLEAMALEVPIVASDLPASREVATAEGAVLVPAGDPAALAAALGSILDDPAAPATAARVRAARDRFESSYSLDASADGMAGLYAHVAALGRSGRFRTHRRAPGGLTGPLGLGRELAPQAGGARLPLGAEPGGVRTPPRRRVRRAPPGLARRRARRSRGGRPAGPGPALHVRRRRPHGPRARRPRARRAACPPSRSWSPGASARPSRSGGRSSTSGAPGPGHAGRGRAEAGARRRPARHRRRGQSGHRPPAAPTSVSDELVAMERLGIEIGSHSLTHPILDRCDDETIDRELVGSADALEGWLGRRPRAFAYPNGDHDERVRAAVARAGYSAAFAFDHRLEDPAAMDLLRVRRLRIDAADPVARLRLVTSGLEPRVLHALGRVR